MLTHLTVQNYALIRQLDIPFNAGFTVITGETGAGKSILLGALNLMLGKRADVQVLFDKSKKCIVEGIFSIGTYNLEEFFKINDLEYDGQCIIRREIGINGKSRAFINDTPVNINLLKELGEQLIDIHSQHQTLALNESGFQLTVVDSYAGITENIKKYRQLFANYSKLQKELEVLVDQEGKSKSEQDFIRFLFDELESAKLVADEQELLEGELQLLNHAEEIKSKLHQSLKLLNENEVSILSQLSEIRSILNGISKYGSSFDELTKRLESTLIELGDLNQEIEKNAESVSFQPEKINQIRERIDLIYRLQAKHRVNSVHELLDLQSGFGVKLDHIDSLEEQINTLKLQLLDAQKLVFAEAKFISDTRRKHFKAIQHEIESITAELGMAHARFGIQHQLLETPGKDGIDNIRFLFNANKGGELMEVSKVASGGELSRLMLAIKSLISQKNLLPTVIFDEIDIGVSGRVADKVGSILARLADSMQVIAITHLPQIAGKGNTHYFVYKETDHDSTKTDIRILDNEDRILEIAKMLSGQEVTSASVETAKHLLNN